MEIHESRGFFVGGLIVLVAESFRCGIVFPTPAFVGLRIFVVVDILVVEHAHGHGPDIFGMPHVDGFLGRGGIFPARGFVARFIQVAGDHAAVGFKALGADVPEHGQLVFVIGVVVTGAVLVGQF
ncbi:MAG: hypothetical protein ACD_75C00367G0001, partial [uncultured bacterium]